MQITSYCADGLLRLSLAGDLDMATTPGLRRQIAADLARTQPRTLVIDAAGLEFCDSAGIQVLVDTRYETAQNGIGFRVTNVHGISRRTLEISGVLGLLTDDPANVKDGWAP